MVQKRKTFCLEYFKTGHGTNSAVTAGYSEKTADVTASVLLRNTNIQAYLKELQDKAEAETVAKVLERKQVLTEIIRTKHDDIDANKPEKSRNAALSSVKRSETKFGETVTITLESKTTAIDLLNKMDGAYAPEKSAVLLVNVEKGDLTDEQLAQIAGAGDIPSRGGNGASEKTASS